MGVNEFEELLSCFVELLSGFVIADRRGSLVERVERQAGLEAVGRGAAVI